MKIFRSKSSHFIFLHVMFNISISIVFLILTGSSVNKLKSDAQVSIPVEVKFVNRAKQEVQLEWITPQGRREKKKVLRKGRCWRTSSWEGHYWVCCDPKHDEHLFALNYGLHYRVHKTRRARERVVITAGTMLKRILACVASDPVEELLCILAARELEREQKIDEAEGGGPHQPLLR